MTDHDAEMDALAEQLRAAGLLTISTDAQSGTVYTLTPEGERMAQQPAMSGDESPLDALLGGVEEGRFLGIGRGLPSRWPSASGGPCSRVPL